MNKKESPLQNLWQKDGTKSLVSSLISILAGMCVGGIIVLIVGLTNDNISLKGAFEGIKLIFFGIFSTGRDAAGNLTFGFSPVNIGNMFFRATPIILTGLSVAVAFKTGLFNIGAPGQYLMGTAASLYLALSIPTTVVPSWLVWLIAFVGGMLAGALWGAIPGIVKAYLNINEVLACIMTNWIAANLVTWFFESSTLRNSKDYGKTGYIQKTTDNAVSTAKLGLDKLFPNSQINAGILIAILIAVVVYIIMTKTTLGFELKACGSNRHAAKYAGIKDKKSIVLSMAIAGSLSGAAAALYYLAGNTEFFWSTYQSLPSEGFNGIPVALLAYNNPIAVIFSGCFMSMLNIAGQQLKTLTAYNEYITDIIIASIVYLSAFALFIKLLLDGKKKHVKTEVTVPTADSTVGDDGAGIEESKDKEENT